MFAEEVVNLGNEKFNETAGEIRYAREKIFRRIVEKSPDDASNKSKKKTKRKSTAGNMWNATLSAGRASMNDS